MYLRLLIVEDEDTVIKLWNNEIEGHNADCKRHGFRIEREYAKSASAARAALKKWCFDAAVVDLRLETDAGQSPPNNEGNNVVREILGSFPIAVAIHTGEPSQADEFKQQPQVKVFSRGGGLAPVFQWLAEQRTMLERIREVRHLIEQEMARIFFKNIWPRWSLWNDGTDSSDLVQAVARHMAAHIHDALLDSGDGKTLPEEAYFKPSLKERIDTGDLVELENALWIVLTPRCDLAHPNKTATILLAKCTDIGETWKKAHENQKQKLVQHNHQPKKHFLHPIREDRDRERGPWFACFDDLKVIPVGETTTQELRSQRIASLAPQFVPSLVERFGACFSRIGTPDFSTPEGTN